MVKKVVPFKSAYDVALEVAYKTLQQKVEHLVRYTNQCKREGDSAEYEDALNELLVLTNAKAKIAIMRTHAKIIEHILGEKY